MFNSKGSNNESLALNERAWEGQVGGSHWIARVIHLDESNHICGLHVASGSERDVLAPKANCRWDYECDHFLDRFTANCVPVDVTFEMLTALRSWLDNFRRTRQCMAA
jgi:hypothetical protein